MRSHLALLIAIPVLLTSGQAMVPGEPASQDAQDDELRGEPGADLTARFAIDERLQVTLWAGSPQLYNPTAMDVDARGRLWVTEAVNYRKWNKANAGREHEGGDRVMILEDTNGDGACDSSKVFVQDPDLLAPLGICVVGPRVFVSCSPNIFVYTDEDGDDVADKREVFLEGFGGRDHDHGVHSLVVGPDGRLWGAAGNAGPHVVTDKDGFTMRAGNGRNPFLSDDGTLATGGIVFSIEPDGTDLRVFAHNFRNNYEVALDSFGNVYQSDNDDDGNRSCRTTWVMRGGNYGFFSADGRRSWRADMRPGQEIQAAHWHQDDPGVAPPGTINGAGGPTGVAIYEVSLPDQGMRWLDSAVLNCDAGAGVVYAHMPSIEGAGIQLEPGTLIGRAPGIQAKDVAWFRPSDVTVGLDGAIFVADWYDPGVGGHAARDREAYGRILRIAPRDKPGKGPAVAMESMDDLWRAQRSPAVNVRGAAAIRLLEVLRAGGDPARDARAGARASSPGLPAVRSRALALQGSGASAETILAGAGLSSSHPMQAHQAVHNLRLLEGLDAEALRSLEPLSARPAGVRGLVARALRGRTDDQAFAALIDLARAYEAGDRYMLESIGLGAEGLEAELYDELLLEMGDTPSHWSPAMADLAWRLHPVAAVPSFSARAMDATLSPAARRQALDSLAFVQDRSAGEAMVLVALAGPDDVRDPAQWWVKTRATNDWSAYDLLAQMGGDEAEKIFASPVIRAGLIDVEVDVSRAKVLWLIVGDGGDSYSDDWADWINPRFVGEQGEQPLDGLEMLHAESGWGRVRVGKNCSGGPLRVDGQQFEQGIGTHAKSRVAFKVPPGAQRFLSQAGPDEGGNGSTSVRFEVWLELIENHEHLHAWKKSLTQAAGADERADAARSLAADPQGALILIRMAAAGELSNDLKSATAQAIFKNPDLGVRALASEHFTRPGAAGTPLPPLAELAALQGDAALGNQLFHSQRAQCSSCHTYRDKGESIGPDLTRIRDKYDRSALLDAILNPNAGIAFGYETYVLETDDGLYLSGFILADGVNVVLKDTQGKRQVIPADEIVARHKQDLSTMPEGVALGLTAAELASIAEFLLTD